MGPLWILSLVAMQPEVAIAVDPTVPATLDFATLLSSEIDAPATVRTSSVSFERILTGRLPPWPEGLLAAFEPRTGRVVVVRRVDGTVLLRTLDEAASRAAYAVAIAAAELIRYARLPIPAKGDTPRIRLLPALYLALGGGISESFGHEPLVIEPRFAVGGELLDPVRGVFSRFALGVRAPVEAEKAMVRYRRWGPSASFAAGWAGGWIRVGGRFEAGVAFTEAAARTKAGDVEGRDRRTPVWATIGPFFELVVGAGLSLVLETSLGWSASPADYLVRNDVALAEGRFRWNASAAVAWRWQSQ